jgi:hypothetical protein
MIIRPEQDTSGPAQAEATDDARILAAIQGG